MANEDALVDVVSRAIDDLCKRMGVYLSQEYINNDECRVSVEVDEDNPGSELHISNPSPFPSSPRAPAAAKQRAEAEALANRALEKYKRAFGRYPGELDGVTPYRGPLGREPDWL